MIEMIGMTLGLIRRARHSRPPDHSSPVVDARTRMATAVLLLRHDNETDLALTAFTALDGEDFKEGL